MISSRVCINSFGKVNEKLSVEQLIKCDKRNSSCESGNPLNSLLYSQENGLKLASCADKDPSLEHNCLDFVNNSKSCKSVYLIENSIQKFEFPGPIMQEIMFNGPVVAFIDLYENFSDYKDGIYQPQGILKGKHSILLIGWFRDYPGETEYWIAKNSFGEGFGVNGYIKIPFGIINVDKEVYSVVPK